MLLKKGKKIKEKETEQPKLAIQKLNSKQKGKNTWFRNISRVLLPHMFTKQKTQNLTNAFHLWSAIFGALLVSNDLLFYKEETQSLWPLHTDFEFKIQIQSKGIC